MTMDVDDTMLGLDGDGRDASGVVVYDYPYPSPLPDFLVPWSNEQKTGQSKVQSSMTLCDATPRGCICQSAC